MNKYDKFTMNVMLNNDIETYNKANKLYRFII